MSEADRLRQQIDELERECEHRLSSGRYRIGALIVDTARDIRQWHRFPLRAWKLLRSLKERQRPPKPGSAVFETARARLDEFATRVREQAPEQVLFVFSGTTCIQGVRGNRPIRQTLEARRHDIPVLFSYHRTRYDEPLPGVEDHGLLQIPVDVTMQLLERLSNLDFGATRRIFLVSYPLPGIETEIEILRERGWVAFYDCRDDWEAFRKVGMANWYNRRIERRVVRECDATLCVSGALCKKMQGMAPDAKVLLSPNAVDSAILKNGMPARKPAQPPVIGYFGHLSAAWFDWSALRRVAHLRPQYRFEIIGHSAPTELDLPSNVLLRGAQPWHRLAELTESWSVGIIPFRMGPLADGVDPIKVYEYLAFGLPVVSFRMPQIEGYPGVQTVETNEAFAVALDVACNSVVDSEAVRDFLSRNTWRVRIRELLHLAQEMSDS